MSVGYAIERHRPAERREGVDDHEQLSSNFGHTPVLICLRRAAMADAAMLLMWRNDPLTRQNSCDGNLVSESEHLNWLSEALASKTRRLFIVELDNAAVGTVRCDDCYEFTKLSWTVAPERRGRGIGSALLAKIVEQECGRTLCAEIKADNSASIKLALLNGFRRIASDPDGLIRFERRPD